MNIEPCQAVLFHARESRLAPLDALSRSLWLGALTNAQGSLEPRLAALAELREGLLKGGLAPAASWRWPAQPICHPLADAIGSLGLADFCVGQESLADAVLMSLLFHLDLIVDYRDRGATEQEAAAMAIAAFADDWKARCDQLQELVDVLGMLPDGAKSTRWDLLCGLLRSEGWQEVVRIRRLIERLPELARILRELGRAQQRDEPDEQTASAERMVEQSAQCADSRTIHVPDLPGETRGIRRSDRVGRMLPAEAMLLGHPRLRLVWHARRAERTLLTYEDDDRLQEIRLHDDRVSRPDFQARSEKRLELGPMLVCVDTSGSMQGGAEAVAKATVLEAVRVAHAQKRLCHVFAFGGPDELMEMELGVDAEGIERLIRFLGQAFRGGTDICGPLERALAKLEEERWQLADLLIASDGEFGATADVVARLESAKLALGLRVQGVLIGDRETIGLLEVADAIFWVRDWRRYGGSRSESPVHSKSLTAMYFPGALRGPQSRGETVSGADGAAAVRAGSHGAARGGSIAPDRL